MGRTRRRRLLKKRQKFINNFNTDSAIIELNKWLKKNLWMNETKLKIASFPYTGRGVMSTRNIDSGDIIIEIPYELIISYTVLENCENFKSLITNTKEQYYIHELLSLYLLLQQHLGTNSSWYSYLKSLPVMDELNVLWLSTVQELGYINEELSILVTEERNKLEQSWKRVRALLKSKYTCWHCGARVNQVLTRDMYIWSYLLVHTRSVYIDPSKVMAVSNQSLQDFLIDDPSMGLSPFLDMFNHNYNTNTQAYLSDVNGILNYFLVTSSKFKKYEQVFISYGAHDNKRLVTQYGFVLPRNEYDTIEFTLKNIFSVLKISANSKQYKFIKERELDKYIFITYSGCSFNMAAVLYVLTNETEIDWTIKIFSNEYTPEQIIISYKLAKQLLESKLEKYNNELRNIKLHRLSPSRHFEVYISYIQSRVEFVKEVLNNIVSHFVL